MNKGINRIAAAVGALAIRLSCTGGETTDYPLLPFRQETPVRLDDLFRGVEITPLETTEASLLSYPRTAENLPGHPVRIRPKQLLAPAVRPGREVHPTDRTDRARPRRVHPGTRFSDRPRRANRLAAQSHRGDHHLRIRRRFHPAGTTARTSRQLPALRAARCEEPRHLVVFASSPRGRRPDLDPRGFRAAKPLFPRVGSLVVA